MGDARRPRTVLFVDHAGALGGAERSLLLLLEGLDRNRFRPHLAGYEGAWLAEAAALDVPVHTVPLRQLRGSPTFGPSWLRGAIVLARLTRRIGAAVLHANTIRATLYTALAARFARRPFVWHMRDYWLTEAKPRWLFPDRVTKRLLCASAAAVVANSRSVASHLGCPERTRVVHNGIDVDAFEPGREGRAFREQHGIPERAPLVGMVARLRPWKGQEAFLRAASVVLARVPEARFVVVGGDPFGVRDGYAQRLERLARELNVAGRTTFTGHMIDVRPALAAMDVFVHPGEPEPLGLANLEAMAMELPIVAFAHGALPEIVEEGTTGRLVTAHDATALGAAVAELVEDPERARAMGAAARRRAAEKFDVRRTCEDLQRLYDELLEG